MFAFTIESSRDLVVGIAAVLASLGAIYRYAIRPILNAFRRVEAAVKATEAEMKPNGGTTLRDVANRIEAKVDNHEARLAALEAALAALEAKLREPVVASVTTKTITKTVEPAHIVEPEVPA